MKYAAWLFSLTLTIALATTIFLRQKQTPSSTSGRLIEASGEQILSHIQDLNAPLVLVNFWASWCEPCKLEFPALLSLKSRFQNQGLRIVLVSVDEQKDHAAADAFLREQGDNLESFYRGSQPLSFVQKIYPRWQGAIPMTLLIRPQGQIVDAWEGETSLEEFEARIRRHLPENPNG